MVRQISNENIRFISRKFNQKALNEYRGLQKEIQSITSNSYLDRLNKSYFIAKAILGSPREVWEETVMGWGRVWEIKKIENVIEPWLNEELNDELYK